MKKMVVKEIKILDQEKYDALDEKIVVGSIFDMTDLAYFYKGWIDEDSFSMRIEDETDDNWNSIPREYGLHYINNEGIEYTEILKTEKEGYVRAKELAHLFGTVSYDFAQI